MEKTTVKIREIPNVVLPVVCKHFIGGERKAYLNGIEMEEIFIFRGNQYRVNTKQGQFRYDLDTDQEIEIY